MLYANSLFAQVTISSNTTWNNNLDRPIGYEDGIILGPGVTLTIQPWVTLEMKSGSIIEVSNLGSKLLLYGPTITSDDPSNNNLWGGIRVNGSQVLDQYTTFPDPTALNNSIAFEGILNTQMPLVLLSNHTEITHAKIGIQSVEGGIIRTNYCDFIDNEIGIKISSYEHPDKIVSGQLISGTFINACQIFNSTFVWSKDNFNVDNNTKKGIHLNYVHSIPVGGCYFANNHRDINNIYVPYCHDQRGTGIHADYASILATTSGNTFCYDEMGCLKNCEGGSPGAGNTFENLTFGTYTTGGRRWNTGYVVTNSSFVNNYRSIFSELHIASDHTALKALENNFSGERSIFETLITDDENLCGAKFSDLNIVDISIKNAVSSDIYMNSFSYSGTNITHISSNNIYSLTPRIINNTFANSNSSTVASDNVFGVRVKGLNPNSVISCNTFTNMGTDIKIDEGATVKSPMTDKNGNAAYNSFSDVLTGRLRIDNSGNTIIEYLVENDDNEDDFHPLSSPTSINVTVSEDNNPEREPDDCMLECTELVTDNFLSASQHYSELIKYNLYPNPTTGLINFESKNEFINSYSIYSVTGKIVTSQKALGQSFSVNTDNYTPGIYYISIQFKSSTQLNLKFIVQK